MRVEPRRILRLLISIERRSFFMIFYDIGNFVPYIIKTSFL